LRVFDLGAIESKFICFREDLKDGVMWANANKRVGVEKIFWKKIIRDQVSHRAHRVLALVSNLHSVQVSDILEQWALDWKEEQSN
jgi:hypothetical protein